MANALSGEHLTYCGAIVNQFARYELIMLGVMATMLKVEVAPLGMIVSGLGYTAKRDAFLSLLRAKTMPPEHLAKVEEFDAAIHTYVGLRNAIAHSTWVEGTRPDSAKPFSYSVRGGRFKIKGLANNERDYTPEELFEIGNKLITLNNALSAYVESVGLADRSTALSSESTSDDPGKPSAK